MPRLILGLQAFCGIVIKEALLWYSLPTLFVALYVIRYRFPPDTALSHLYLVSMLAGMFIALKLLLLRLFKRQLEALFLVAIGFTVIAFVLIIYYGLVILGLESWGKVITAELILSYASNARAFCESIGISFPLVVSALLISFILTASANYYLHKRLFSSFPGTTTSSTTTVTVSLLLAALFVLFAHQLINRLFTPDLDSNEAVNLTLYSGKDYLDGRFYPWLIPFRKSLEEQENAAIGNYQVNPNADRKNVILVIVDALRPGHMSLYGYGRNTTPFLSSLEEKGELVKINQARASCPETTCALSSLLASRHPHLFPKNAFTLMQVLKKHGYRTTMILGGDHTNFYNLRKVYGDVDSYYDGSMERKYFFNDDSFVIERAKALPDWDGKPAYLQFHLMSVHALGLRHADFQRFMPSSNYVGNRYGNPAIQHVNHYDNGVVQMDHCLNALFAVLGSKKYLANALVVITSDHGEMLGEHQLYQHANGVWEEALHIPLMFVNFSGDSKDKLRNSGFLSAVDIAPTILSELSIPVPNSWIGKAPQNEGRGHFAFFRWPPNAGLYDIGEQSQIWKYWMNFNTGEEFIFDISKDPQEKENLAWAPALKHRKADWRKAIETVLTPDLAKPQPGLASRLPRDGAGGF